MPDEEACAAIAALMDEDKSKMNRRLQELYELVGTGNLDERRRSIVESALEKIRALPSLNETASAIKSAILFKLARTALFSRM